MRDFLCSLLSGYFLFLAGVRGGLFNKIWIMVEWVLHEGMFEIYIVLLLYIKGIIQCLRHTTGFRNVDYPLKNIADSSSDCELIPLDRKSFGSILLNTALPQSKTLFGSVHPREDTVILEIFIGINDGRRAAETYQKGGNVC